MNDSNLLINLEHTKFFVYVAIFKIWLARLNYDSPWEAEKGFKVLTTILPNDPTINALF